MLHSLLKSLKPNDKKQFSAQSQAYFYGLGKPMWMDRNYVEFANEAYIKNVIAHRSITMIAHAAANIPIKLYQRQQKSWHPLEEHEILNLIQKPNLLQSGKEFLEAIYIYRQISGNAYILGIEGPDKKLHELYTLRPDRVQVIAGESFVPTGYRYIIGSQHIDYPVDNVLGRSPILHIKNFHPLSDWYGLSSIEAAAYSIDQHNKAGAWNQALLQNGARPSGAIMLKNDQPLSEEQFYRLRSTMEEAFSGPTNAGRPLLLESGLEWKEMSLSPRDMDHIASKNNSAREIALALGVPPQLLGIPGDNTYSNLSEARIALWEQTVIPLVENTIDSLNRWLSLYFDSNLALRHDPDCISALAGRMDAIWQRLENSSFMTINEKRKTVGLAPLKEGDQLTG